MVEILKRSTANFNLGIPNFDAPGWGAIYERSMDIIDAVLATTGAVTNIVGAWEQNTPYGVDDRVVDTTDNSVWQVAVAHTSGMTTFAADRAANPTYWVSVTRNVVVRGQFLTGRDYFVGDFVYDTSEKLGGIVIQSFTGLANLRDHIAKIGVIYDLKADLALIPGIQTDITALQGRATSLENTRVRHDAVQGLTLAQQGQARTNIGADLMGPYRNVLINGGCDIGQRATSGTIAAGATGFGPDRIAIVNNTNQALTWGIAPVFNFFTGEARSFLNINFAVAPTTGNVDIVQRVEDVFTLAGQKASLVFYCSSNVSAANSAMSANIFQSFGTGGSPSATVNTSMAALNVPAVRDDTTVRRHTTVDVPSVIGKVLGTNNNDFLGVRVSFVPRQTGDYRFSRFAFVKGDATAEADPFSPRHIQQELMLCKRYYQKSYAIGTPPATNTVANIVYWLIGGATGNYGGRQALSPSMRINPTITIYPADGASAGQANTDALGKLSASVIAISPDGFNVFVSGGASNPGAVFGHFVAEAEL